VLLIIEVPVFFRSVLTVILLLSPSGLEDGKVRALHCKSNKSQSLYGGDSICISLAANTKGSGFLSGHNDGTIIRYYLSEEASEPLGRVVQHPVPPFGLAWPQGGFCAAGCDQRIIFYDSVVSRKDEGETKAILGIT